MQCFCGHLTDDETLHLVFPQHVHPQCLSDLVVELVSASTCRHNAELPWVGTIQGRLLVPQVFHKLDAVVYPIGLEALEVESSARVC